MAKTKTAPKEDKYTKATLNYINKVRKQIGLKPISKLLKETRYFCSIANSLKQSVRPMDIEAIQVDKYAVRLSFVKSKNVSICFYDLNIPKNVQIFIDKFDKGEYS